MKTIEEKAKAYDEAIEKIKYVMEHGVQPVLFLKKHFEETPQEELDKEWKEIEPLNDIGPNVLEYTEYYKKGE